MNWFRREAAAVQEVGDKIAEVIERDVKTLKAVEAGIMDRSAAAIDDVLDKAKTERDRLGAEIVHLQGQAVAWAKDFEAKIADRTEKLRHTGIVISAFEAAQAALAAATEQSHPDPASAPAAPAVGDLSAVSGAA